MSLLAGLMDFSQLGRRRSNKSWNKQGASHRRVVTQGSSTTW